MVSWLVWDIASKSSRQIYQAQTGRARLNFAEQLGLGFVSSATTLSVTYPLDMLKTRFQSQGETRRLPEIAREVVRLHGVRSFYVGLSIALVHHSLHDAIQGVLRQMFAIKSAAFY